MGFQQAFLVVILEFGIEVPEYSDSPSMRVLVTGANGLVGRALCGVLEQSGFQVIRAVRHASSPLETTVGEIDGVTNWDPIFDVSIDAVVHLAARVPLPGRASKQAEQKYFRVNSVGTAHLAKQCLAQGVKRFILISSAKVLGDGRNKVYCGDDLAAPGDAYAFSKLESELVLKQLTSEAKMEIVIIRPPLVYGPDVKGNFLGLMRLVDRRWPLPFGAIENRRSLIYLGNLVDAIKLCLVHPLATGKTYMVSDGDDVSTPELINRLASAMGRAPALLKVPPDWMNSLGRLLGKGATVDRLLGSFFVDIQPIRDDLGWTPPYSLESGFVATADWFRRKKEAQS